jgi:hypothetical protein
MKRQIYRVLLGLIIGGITVYVIKKLEMTGITYADFLPLIAIAIYFVYQNYQLQKKQSNLYKKKIEGIDKSQTVAIDNYLISKSETENNLVLVRNELFWIDEVHENSIENLLENFIHDFKKLIESDNVLKNRMQSNYLEFTLIDNVNNNRILAQKRVNYDEL